LSVYKYISYRPFHWHRGGFKGLFLLLLPLKLNSCTVLLSWYSNGIFHRDVKPENILIKVSQHLFILFIMMLKTLPADLVNQNCYCYIVYHMLSMTWLVASIARRAQTWRLWLMQEFALQAPPHRVHLHPLVQSPRVPPHRRLLLTQDGHVECRMRFLRDHQVPLVIGCDQILKLHSAYVLSILAYPKSRLNRM
jgi:hypothetical protein